MGNGLKVKNSKNVHKTVVLYGSVGNISTGCYLVWGHLTEMR